MNSDTPSDPRYVPSTYDPGSFDRPSVTVDVVLFAFRDQQLQVLLVRRRNWPYQGYWAIPGGFIQMDESLEQSALRELQEETGVEDVYLEQLYTFGEAERDPRTRVISIAYFALVGADQALQVRGGDDAAEARWWSMASLPPLAFDHDRILRYAHQRLRWKLEYTALGFLLLPETFTLSELQAVYQVVLGEQLDKRNFRRKILSTGVLEETDAYREGSPHRPARLYRFTAAAIELEQARRRFP
ncbi:MAG TPA: NUDIX domain-containing protein [Anaerolineae bacterium]|nr:NUDIX domain-containing protein [Anaerolineae bacterium]HNU06013.1 NUDIX domain-containing protein [Anaerolineae bacterium]